MERQRHGFGHNSRKGTRSLAGPHHNTTNKPLRPAHWTHDYNKKTSSCRVCTRNVYLRETRSFYVQGKHYSIDDEHQIRNAMKYCIVLSAIKEEMVQNHLGNRLGWPGTISSQPHGDLTFLFSRSVLYVAYTFVWHFNVFFVVEMGLMQWLRPRKYSSIVRHSDTSIRPINTEIQC